MYEKNVIWVVAEPNKRTCSHADVQGKKSFGNVSVRHCRFRSRAHKLKCQIDIIYCKSPNNNLIISCVTKEMWILAAIAFFCWTAIWVSPTHATVPDAPLAWYHEAASAHSFYSSAFRFQSLVIVETASADDPPASPYRNLLAFHVTNGTPAWSTATTTLQCRSFLDGGAAAVCHNASNQYVAISFATGSVLWVSDRLEEMPSAVHVLPSAPSAPKMVAFVTKGEVRALSLATGALLWKLPFASFEDGFGNVQKMVYTERDSAAPIVVLGTMYNYGLVAVDAEKGTVVWGNTTGRPLAYDATPWMVADSRRLFAVSTVNGVAYELNASDGTTKAEFALPEWEPQAEFLFVGGGNGRPLLMQCGKTTIRSYDLNTQSKVLSVPNDFNILSKSSVSRVYLRCASGTPANFEVNGSTPVYFNVFDAATVLGIHPRTGEIFWVSSATMENPRSAPIVVGVPQLPFAFIASESTGVLLDLRTQQTKYAYPQIDAPVISVQLHEHMQDPLVVFISRKGILASFTCFSCHVKQFAGGQFAVRDGTLYIAEKRALTLISAWRMHPSYGQLWVTRSSIPGVPHGPPMVGNQVLFITLRDTNTVLVLNKATGRIIQTIFLTEYCGGLDDPDAIVHDSKVALDQDDNAYFTSGMPCIYRVNASGHVRVTSVESPLTHMPVVHEASGTVFTHPAEHHVGSLYAIDKTTMTLRWKAAPPEPFGSAARHTKPLVVAHGSIVAFSTQTSYSATVWAASIKNGGFVWMKTLKGDGFGVVDVHSWGAHLLLIATNSVAMVRATDGSSVWTVTLPNHTIHSAVSFPGSSSFFLSALNSTLCFRGVTTDSPPAVAWESPMSLNYHIIMANDTLIGAHLTEPVVQLIDVRSGNPWHSYSAIDDTRVWTDGRELIYSAPDCVAARALPYALHPDSAPIPTITPSEVPVPTVPVPFPTPGPTPEPTSPPPTLIGSSPLLQLLKESPTAVIVTDHVFVVGDGNRNFDGYDADHPDVLLWQLKNFTGSCSNGLVACLGVAVCADHEKIGAFDLDTGLPAWNYTLATTAENFLCTSNAIIFYPGRSYLAEAINPKNGKLIWSNILDLTPINYWTEVPSKGVYVHVSYGMGVIRASNGAELWTSYDVLLVVEEKQNLVWVCSGADLKAQDIETGEIRKTVNQACADITCSPVVSTAFPCPTNAPNGSTSCLFVNGRRQIAFALPSGTVLWVASTSGGSSDNSVAYYSDGILVAPAADLNQWIGLEAATGRVRWTIPCPDMNALGLFAVQLAPHLIVLPGLICVNTSSGAVIWSYSTTPTRTTPIVKATNGGKGLVYGSAPNGFGALFLNLTVFQDTYGVAHTAYLATPFYHDRAHVIHLRDSPSSVVYGFELGGRIFAFDTEKNAFLWTTQLRPLPDEVIDVSVYLSTGLIFDGSLYLVLPHRFYKVRLADGEVEGRTFVGTAECDASRFSGGVTIDPKTHTLYLVDVGCLYRIDNASLLSSAYVEDQVPVTITPLLYGSCVLISDLSGHLHCYDPHLLQLVWSQHLVPEDFPIISLTAFGSMVYATTESHVFCLEPTPDGSLRVANLITPGDDFDALRYVTLYNRTAILESRDGVLAYDAELKSLLWTFHNTSVDHSAVIIAELGVLLVMSQAQTTAVTISNGQVVWKLEGTGRTGCFDVQTSLHGNLCFLCDDGISIVSPLTGKRLHLIGGADVDQATFAVGKGRIVLAANPAKNHEIHVFHYTDRGEPPAAGPTNPAPTPTLPNRHVAPTLPPTPQIPPDLTAATGAPALVASPVHTLGTEITSYVNVVGHIIAFDAPACALSAYELRSSSVVWRQPLSAEDCISIKENRLFVSEGNSPTVFYSFNTTNVIQWSVATGNKNWVSAPLPADSKAPTIFGSFVISQISDMARVTVIFASDGYSVILPLTSSDTECSFAGWSNFYSPSPDVLQIIDNYCIGTFSISPPHTIKKLWFRFQADACVAPLAVPSAPYFLVPVSLDGGTYGFRLIDAGSGNESCSWKSSSISQPKFFNDEGRDVYMVVTTAGYQFYVQSVLSCARAFEAEVTSYQTFSFMGGILLTHSRDDYVVGFNIKNGSLAFNITVNLPDAYELKATDPLPGTDTTTSRRFLPVDDRARAFCSLDTWTKFLSCAFLNPTYDSRSTFFHPQLGSSGRGAFVILTDREVAVSDLATVNSTMFMTSSFALRKVILPPSGTTVAHTALLFDSAITFETDLADYPAIANHTIVPAYFLRFPPTISFEEYCVVGSSIVFFVSENDKHAPYDPTSYADHVVVVDVNSMKVTQTLEFGEACSDPLEDPYVEPSLEAFVVSGMDVYFTAKTRCVYALHCSDATHTCQLSTRLLDHYGLHPPVVAGNTVIAIDKFAYAHGLTRNLQKLWRRNLGYFAQYGPPSDILVLPSGADTELVVVTGPVAVASNPLTGEPNWACALDVVVPGALDMTDVEIGYDPASGLVIVSVLEGVLVTAIRRGQASEVAWQFSTPQHQPSTFAIQGLGNVVAERGVVVLALASSLIGLEASSGATLWKVAAKFKGTPPTQYHNGLLYAIGEYEAIVVDVLTGKLVSTYFGITANQFRSIVVSDSGVVAFGFTRETDSPGSDSITRMAVLSGMAGGIPPATAAPTTAPRTSQPPSGVTTQPPPTGTAHPTTVPPAKPESGTSVGVIVALVAAGLVFVGVIAYFGWRTLNRHRPRLDSLLETGVSMSERKELKKGDGETTGTFGSLQL